MELRVKKIRVEYEKMEMKSDNNSIEIEKPRFGGSWLDIQFDEEIEDVLEQVHINDVVKHYDHFEILEKIPFETLQKFLEDTDEGNSKLDEMLLRRQRIKKLKRII